MTAALHVVPKVDGDLTEAQARELTERIRATTEDLWRLLTRAYEGRAWKPLGYRGLKDYVETEFNISRGHAYHLLHQGRVITTLTEAVGQEVSAIADTSLWHARAIKPHLDTVVEEVQDRMRDGEEPEDAFTNAVAPIIEAANNTHAVAAYDALPKRHLPQGFRPKASDELLDKVLGTALPTQIDILTDAFRRLDAQRVDVAQIKEWVSLFDVARRDLGKLRRQLIKEAQR